MPLQAEIQLGMSEKNSSKTLGIDPIWTYIDVSYDVIAWRQSSFIAMVCRCGCLATNSFVERAFSLRS